MGSDISNLRLSDLRAATVARILTDFYGVPPENLATQGYGERYLKIRTEAAERELGSLADQFSHGEFAPLKNWLQRHIHDAGQCYTAAQLVERVTGQPLSHAPLIRHLRGKLGPLYGL